ncbi:MAG TPA: hypothetical protein VH440_07590 [Candidatus Limnocylindrales bacterium]
MEILLVLALLVAVTIVGLYDRYSVQRAYADVYAQVHGHVPPLYEWFYTADPHPDVDHWRKLHRNFLILTAALTAAMFVAFVAVLPK